ncbi:MAG: methyltransferase domain-containing protein [Parachlamydiaceae bacterium]|nr:methyltransferase domain-containing protein [Parachlamydiaceae bacterium]
MKDFWSLFVEKPDRWKSPLRPSSDDVIHFCNQIPIGSRTLLLGITQELLPYATIAIDNNLKAVQANSKIAVFGDWSNLPFESEFDRVIGDGCLNIFQGKPELFFQQMKKVLKKGGKLVLRMFVSPEEKEELNVVFQDKDQMSFHAFQLRVTHAMANPYLSTRDRCQAIKSVWDHPHLEMYEGSSIIHYHPKLSELPPWEVIQFCHSYELSVQCPVITWSF